MKKGNLNNFIEYLNEQVENHSCYCWSAQGQGDPTVTENWIRQREQGTGGMKVNGRYMTYADIAVMHWKEQCDLGYKELLRMYDCSGLCCAYLLSHDLLSVDHTANGLMRSYTDRTEHEPRKGMWLFRTNSDGKATHIGVMVSDSECVHAKGRLYGVVRERYSKAYWSHCYMPKLFDLEEPEPEPEPSPEPTPTVMRYVHPKGRVRVREGNGTSYKQIKPTATKKDYLPMLGQDAEEPYWYLVLWQGRTGYISSNPRYTEVVKK